MNFSKIESSPNHREFYENEARTSLICMDESCLTCLVWAQILGNVSFYAGLSDDALEKNSNRERGLQGGHDPARRFYIWVLSRPVFSIEKLQHRILNVVENTS